MTKPVLLFLFTTLFVIGVVAGLQPSTSEAKVQKNMIGIAQGSGIIWNNTDCNATFAQNEPLIQPSQISPRIITEYADAAFQLGINAPLGLNATGVTPRIIVEYADYANYNGLVPLNNVPPVLLSIGSPVENPIGNVPLYTNKTVSVDVTSPLTPLKNVTISYRTSINQTWQLLTITYASAQNLTSTTAEAVIPGQNQNCNVTYMVEAYNYDGDYAVNDNAGQYYVYSITPEFPSMLLLTLLMTAISLAVMVVKKCARWPNKEGTQIL